MSHLYIIGHRGARAEAPENTLAGFRHAVAIGLDAVEFDVHLSKDRELVIIHDKTVDRTTNGTGPVSDFTATELARMDARADFPGWPEPAGVPLLSEVLDIVENLQRVQIEIKTDAPDRLEEIATGVLREVASRGIADQTLITSFDATAIEIVGRLAPDQARGFIGRPTDLETVDTALRFGHGHVQFHRFREHDPAQIQRAHDAGLAVGGGPCDTPEELHAALALGFTGVTTDHPSLLKEHLAQQLTRS